MKNNDFDFIKNQFEKENINAPYTLDSKVVDNLNGKEQKKIKLYESKMFKSIAVAVACVAVVITALAVTKPYILNNDNGLVADENNQVVNTFSSYSEIKSAINKMSSSSDVKGLESDNIVYAVDETVSEETGGYGGSSYAETYKQVDSVDEGDIIKNDGKYIYFVSNNIIKIYSADGDDTQLVSTIDDFYVDYSYDYDGVNNYVEEYISDIYVYGDKLVVNNNTITCENNKFSDSTTTHIYDLSDITQPSEINSFSQSGDYTSSRMIGSELYIVSYYYVNRSECKDDTDYAPYVSDGSVTNPVGIDCICYADNPDSPSYLVISAIDVQTGEKSADTKALFGADENIYCNENYMYVTTNQLDWNETSENSSEANLAELKLNIVKIKLTANDIEFVATGQVSGDINNQFSLDEKDGNLRVATTSYDDNGNLINNIFVLDEDLNKIGKVTGFAKDESIKAVRFIDNTAYVITYEQVDPLFVIDLSQPTNPQIVGQVEISGFSSMLVPVDDNTILGIGYSTSESEYTDMEVTDGIKLVLFDISNPESPQVMDTYVINDAYSSAQDNHHAIVVNEDKGYYAIPYNKSYDYAQHGAITVNVSNGKINVTNTFTIDESKEKYVSRCTYIGDTLYVLDDYKGDIFSFDMN
jgi:uncharacterized secreted protein with C-terminal beta-propeller domain